MSDAKHFYQVDPNFVQSYRDGVSRIMQEEYLCLLKSLRDISAVCDKRFSTEVGESPYVVYSTAQTYLMGLAARTNLLPMTAHAAEALHRKIRERGTFLHLTQSMFTLLVKRWKEERHLDGAVNAVLEETRFHFSPLLAHFKMDPFQLPAPFYYPPNYSVLEKYLDGVLIPASRDAKGFEYVISAISPLLETDSSAYAGVLNLLGSEPSQLIFNQFLKHRRESSPVSKLDSFPLVIDFLGYEDRLYSKIGFSMRALLERLTEQLKIAVSFGETGYESDRLEALAQNMEKQKLPYEALYAMIEEKGDSVSELESLLVRGYESYLESLDLLTLAPKKSADEGRRAGRRRRRLR